MAAAQRALIHMIREEAAWAFPDFAHIPGVVVVVARTGIERPAIAMAAAGGSIIAVDPETGGCFALLS